MTRCSFRRTVLFSFAIFLLLSVINNNSNNNILDVKLNNRGNEISTPARLFPNGQTSQNGVQKPSLICSILHQINNRKHENSANSSVLFVLSSQAHDRLLAGHQQIVIMKCDFKNHIRRSLSINLTQNEESKVYIKHRLCYQNELASCAGRWGAVLLQLLTPVTTSAPEVPEPTTHVAGACLRPIHYFVDWPMIIEWFEAASTAEITAPYVYWASVDRSTWAILNWYQRTFMVELIQWPSFGQQIDATLKFGGQEAGYNDCLKRAKYTFSHEWIAIVDFDEFFVPFHSYPFNLAKYLVRHYDHKPTVSIIYSRRVESEEDRGSLLSLPENLERSQISLCLSDVLKGSHKSQPHTFTRVKLGKAIVRVQMTTEAAIHHTFTTGTHVSLTLNSTFHILHRRRNKKVLFEAHRLRQYPANEDLRLLDRISALDRFIKKSLNLRLINQGDTTINLNTCLPLDNRNLSAYEDQIEKDKLEHKLCPTYTEEDMADRVPSWNKSEWIRADYKLIRYEYRYTAWWEYLLSYDDISRLFKVIFKISS